MGVVLWLGVTCDCVGVLRMDSGVAPGRPFPRGLCVWRDASDCGETRLCVGCLGVLQSEFVDAPEIRPLRDASGGGK